MATSYTSLLGLALPVQGELSGTWGDVVNNSITSLVDSAVAGTTTLSTDADVTLTTTTGAANTAREAILLCTGARTALRNITAPAQSKTYTVINATTGGFAVVIRGVGPTTGISVPAGFTAQVAWNGSDFVTGAVGAIAATTLSASGAVSGAGFSTYLASPPAIGGTAPAAVSATSLSYSTTLTGGTGIVNLGSGQFYKDASGNVGIGTASPAQIVEANKSQDAKTQIKTTNTNAGVSASAGVLFGTSSGDNGYVGANGGAASSALGGANALQITNLAAAPIVLATNATERMRIDASGNVGVGKVPVAGRGLLQVNGDVEVTSLNTGQLAGLRNRIINGAMTIDQRNAGAAVTVNTTANVYVLDRFAFAGQVTDGVYTVQQSTTVPSKFKNAAIVTVTTADASIGATQNYLISQFVEGLNVYDLAWGTASAAPITLSFWVRSSVTGTFGGAIQNDGLNRSYPFSFTISAANTYEYKTITIAGDTSGTWLTDSGRGLIVRFSLGVGSTYKGTVNAWSAANYFAPTGSVDLISTNAATFYITGVQLELGSVATPFEQRPYGMELALCQRYYYRIYPGAVNKALNSFGAGYSTTVSLCLITFPVTMRITPTALEQSGVANQYSVQQAGTGEIVCTAVPTYQSSTTQASAGIGLTVASGLTQFAFQYAQTNSTNGANAYLGWSAEL